MSNSPRERFLQLFRASVADGALVKLTLGKHRGADPTLRNLFVRPVTLKAGPQLSFVWRHATRDITKNHPPADALALLEPLIGGDFLDAHLFTTRETAQLEARPDAEARLSVKPVAAAAVSPSPLPAIENANTPASHDRAKQHLVAADAPWLRALGVTNERGQPREGMAGKFRQIQKFVELLATLVDEAGFRPDESLRLADMGSGKGYLTFAAAAHLGDRVAVRGIEARPELVALCNEIAVRHGLKNLEFSPGHIADTSSGPLDILIALHACDTATDDALAHGLASGARLLVVSPCCQKELRRQLTAPDVLAPALRHGIFAERQAEFATDALRALLLEWAGYDTKVFEFISTEHTAKNIMITAVKSSRAAGVSDDAAAARVRALAAFYGIKHHHLATRLGFALN